MARVFPNRLPGQVPLELARAFRKLKKLPDDFHVWYSFPEIRKKSNPSLPDFLVIWQERFGFLVHVASTSQEMAETAIQGNLFNPDNALSADDFGKEETKILQQFSADLKSPVPLRPLVLFPNLDQNTVDTISLQQSTKGDHRFLGLRQLGEKAFPEYLESIALSEIPGPAIVHLRHHFSPEIQIPSSISFPRHNDRQTHAVLTPGLLDLDQEWCMKQNLYLPTQSEIETSTSDQQTQLVTGVAGSGKSLVLLYRALLNASLNPGARILVLTHNRPINNELRRRFESLSSRQHDITCLTFFQWAVQILPRWNERVIGPVELREIIQDLTRQVSLASFEDSFIEDEIGFIKDHGIARKSDYFELDRSGRGKGLTLPQRESFWDIYIRYQQTLQKKKLLDWHSIAMRFHRAVTTGEMALEPYDCILIDEAQFFAKTWFDVVRAGLREGGQLFLSADPTQGFLKRRQSWLASGIEVRGRTTRLRYAYRNSRAILSFAASFFKSRLAKNPQLSQEGFNLPDEEQLSKITLEGVPPEIVSGPSMQDLHLRVANELQKLRAAGLPPGQVLILHADSRHLDHFCNTGARVLGDPKLIHNAKSGILPPDAFCQVSSVNAATGLEAPIVFLLGIDRLLDREESPLLSPDERAELHASQTSLLYMAFTRAGQRLVILSTNETRVNELRQLH